MCKCRYRRLAALVWPGVLQLASPQQLGPAQQRGEGSRLQHREPPTVQLPMQWRMEIICQRNSESSPSPFKIKTTSQ